MARCRGYGGSPQRDHGARPNRCHRRRLGYVGGQAGRERDGRRRHRTCTQAQGRAQENGAQAGYRRHRTGGNRAGPGRPGVKRGSPGPGTGPGTSAAAPERAAAPPDGRAPTARAPAEAAAHAAEATRTEAAPAKAAAVAEAAPAAAAPTETAAQGTAAPTETAPTEVAASDTATPSGPAPTETAPTEVAASDTATPSGPPPTETAEEAATPDAAATADTAPPGPAPTEAAAEEAAAAPDRAPPSAPAEVGLFTRYTRDYVTGHNGHQITILQAGCTTADSDLGVGVLREAGADIAVSLIDDDQPVTRAALGADESLAGCVLGDLRTVPLPPRSHDIVLCTLLLQRIDHAELVLDRLVAAIRPGGLLLLRFSDRDSSGGSWTGFCPWRPSRALAQTASRAARPLPGRVRTAIVRAGRSGLCTHARAGDRRAAGARRAGRRNGRAAWIPGRAEAGRRALRAG